MGQDDCCGVNRFAHRTPASVKKLDENKETIQQEAMSHEFRTAMQGADDGRDQNRQLPPPRHASLAK